MTSFFLKITEVGVNDALIISLLCFAIIIGVLAALIGIILLLRLCTNKIYLLTINSKEKKSAKLSIGQNELLPKPTSAVAEAKGSSGDVNIFNVAPKDAAMIMAIVADELKMPLNRLKFKSIKLIEEVGENNEVQG